MVPNAWSEGVPARQFLCGKLISAFFRPLTFSLARRARLAAYCTSKCFDGPAQAC